MFFVPYKLPVTCKDVQGHDIPSHVGAGQHQQRMPYGPRRTRICVNVGSVCSLSKGKKGKRKREKGKVKSEKKKVTVSV